jgi:hypothetical protein
MQPTVKAFRNTRDNAEINFMCVQLQQLISGR